MFTPEEQRFVDAAAAAIRARAAYQDADSLVEVATDDLPEYDSPDRSFELIRASIDQSGLPYDHPTVVGAREGLDMVKQAWAEASQRQSRRAAANPTV